MKCLQCDSERIVRDVRAVDYSDNTLRRDLKLEVYRDPNALIFKGTIDGTLKANVCVDCGFVMFNVSTKDALKLEKVANAQK